MKLCCVYETNR